MNKISVISIIAVLTAILAWFVMPSFAHEAACHSGCSRYTWCTHNDCRCPQFLEAPNSTYYCKCGHARSEHTWQQ